MRRRQEDASEDPGPLFRRVPPAPYAAGSDTSQQAAARKTNLAADRSRVLALIASRGAHGATTDEVEEILGLRHQNASARVWDLAGRNWRHPLPGAPFIVETEAKRRTRSGRWAHVYVALETVGVSPP